MLHHKSKIINLNGSSLNFSAHGWWGKEKNLSAEKSVRLKVLGAKPKQAGKKGGGWGKGIFARPSVQFGARSAPSVPFKMGSDFVKQTHTTKNPL